MAQDIELDLRGLTKSTSDVYLKYSHQFVAHFGRDVDQLGEAHVHSWLHWRRAKLSATTNEKHRAIFLLFYCAGLRISELLALHVSDIDLGRELVRVRGAKSRVLPLPPFALFVIREHVMPCRSVGPWLFPGRAPGSQMTRVAVSEAIRNCAQAAGISKRMHPHLLRRSFATHLLDHGADRRTLEAFLGISSVGARRALATRVW